MTEAQQPADTTRPIQVPPEIQAAPQIPVRSETPERLVSTTDPRLDEAHSAFAEFHAGYVGSYIGLADTKAAWTFAVASGALAYMLGDEEFRRSMLGHSLTWSPTSALFFATAILLLLSAAFSFLVIVPRLSTSGEGIVYFGAVAKRSSASDYVRDIASRKAPDLAQARLKHCYDISKVCLIKYQQLKKAILFGLPGLIGLGLMAFLS